MTTLCKWKGKILYSLAESKWIERKVKGRIKKETSRAMVCLTEGAQQWKSMLRLQIFQIVRRSIGKPDWWIQYSINKFMLCCVKHKKNKTTIVVAYVLHFSFKHLNHLVVFTDIWLLMTAKTRGSWRREGIVGVRWV